MTITPERLKEITDLAEGLIGTCRLSDPPEIEGMTQEECDVFDAIVFCCVACGWWGGEDEKHDDDGGWVCDDCAPEGEE